MREGRQYDVILTSETIYSTANLHKLLALIRACLRPSGIGYYVTPWEITVLSHQMSLYRLVAAKTYYFGVGGGTRQLEEAVHADGAMTSKVCLAIHPRDEIPV